MTHHKQEGNNTRRVLNAMYGPEPRADHRVGERIQFIREGKEGSGEIIGIVPPGPRVVGRPARPVTYLVDTGEGFPIAIYPSDIIETAHDEPQKDQ
jgi:hypothetical protein